METFKNSALIENAWWMRIVATNAILEMNKSINSNLNKLDKKIDNTVDETALSNLKEDKNNHQKVANKLQEAITEIKAKETNTRILEAIEKAK